MFHVNKTDVIFVNDLERDHWEEGNSQSTSDSSVILLHSTTTSKSRTQIHEGILGDNSDIEMIDAKSLTGTGTGTRPRDIIDVDSESDDNTSSNRPPVRSQTSCFSIFWDRWVLFSAKTGQERTFHD